MSQLKYDPDLCSRCETIDCLMKCQYLNLNLEEARREREKIIKGEPSRVLEECTTCYACEEYCPYDNHPFFLLVERQEELGIYPAPVPIIKQQLKMMAPRGKIVPMKVKEPVINLCFFPMLGGCIRGKLFEGASVIEGSDIFCNIMWLHFGKMSAIKERLSMALENIRKYYLEESGVREVVCFHDECYGAFTRLAPAYGIEVPFKPVHLFEYLAKRLYQLRDQIKPINAVVAYQRPCSNRLIPETQHWVDEIFKLIGAERPEREYDGENALCCGLMFRASQRDELADEVQEKNVEDMKAVGAKYCVFNCPVCFFTLSDLVKEKGMTPILMSELCQIALGEGLGW